MLKTTTALALVASASATTPTSKAEAIALVKDKLNRGMNVHQFVAKGTPLSATSLTGEFSVAANTEPGQWMTVTKTTTCGDSLTPVRSYGYKMGFCGEDTESSSWVMYNCTQNSVTGAVTVTSTNYTDSACTAGGVSQTPMTYSDCAGGLSVSCTVETDPSTAVAAEYSSGGLMQLGYDDIADCSAEGADIAYSALMGCDDGFYWGSNSVVIYLTPSCSGQPLASLSYSEIASNGVCDSFMDDDDDGDDNDDDDDDDNIDLSYDNAIVKMMWTDDGDDDCFHVDSKIDYKGVEYTYEELKAGKEPECTVPHSPFSRGVVIFTNCDKTVRVTDTHLMATTKGFQLAYSLKAGDVLFGDYDKEMCTVKTVEKEKTIQQYFGLNCVHSEVLASGLRASTFGDFHTLPSWYMTYVGALVGTDAASSLGEYIAEWYFQK